MSASTLGSGAPGEELSREQLDRLLLERVGTPRKGPVIGAVLFAVFPLLFAFSWGYQIKNGIGVSGLNRPVYWGFYIINFVFWIGISHAGTLISAILRVTQAGWRRPLTRCAEAVTVFAIMIGGLFPLIHLGRPLLFWYLLPLPTYRLLWPNFRSPLVWDVAAITTYLTGSSLYLLLPLIPDFAILRDRATGLRRRLYSVLSLGWRGTPRQWHALETGMKILAVGIIPVAVSVHTIVSWDFAMTMVPGWKSSIFGPYFVVGAIYSGIAVLLTAMWLLRRGLRLEKFLTDRTFSNLGLLFLAMTLMWGYFTFAEHLTAWYSGDAAESLVHHQLMDGRFAPLFWLMVVLNVVIPLSVLPFRWGRKPMAIGLVGLCVLVGMWLERFLIVIPSLSTPRLTFTEGLYRPSLVELGIFAGSIGTFVFLYFAFTALFPIVSIWEMREGWEEEEERIAHARGEIPGPGREREVEATS